MSINKKNVLVFRFKDGSWSMHVSFCTRKTFWQIFPSTVRCLKVGEEDAH